MTKAIISLFTMLTTGTLSAQERIIKLFPEGVPGEDSVYVEVADKTGNKVANETVTRITNVGEPSITIYEAPEELASGSAIIVCPGGGYNILAYDLEGDEVCLWLNELGITAILLKYRVPRRPDKDKHEAPLQDLQRAISVVRANAANLNIDPRRIGVMGFSAGAHLCAMASNSFNNRTYPANDAMDRFSCRPNFCLLVYPAYLSGDTAFQLAPELQVSERTPPTLIIQAEDDKAHINSSLFYYYALKEAGVRAWMHLYSKGGHGYGLRDTGSVVNSWPDRAEDWFREIGLIDSN